MTIRVGKDILYKAKVQTAKETMNKLKNIIIMSFFLFIKSLTEDSEQISHEK
jgi:hypothetical protein